MFRQLIQFCWPYKRQLGWALAALGAILLLVFVPLQVWMALVGILFIIAGIALAKG